MSVLGTILASLAIAAGALASLSLIVLCFAGAPNSSDAQLRMIYTYMALAAIAAIVNLPIREGPVLAARPSAA